MICFFFTIGDKELRKTDKPISTRGKYIRFSPDGKKIAYTKNKRSVCIMIFPIIKRPGLTFDGLRRKFIMGYCSCWSYMEEIT